MSKEGEPKWSCEQCTYLNFRSSVRCTLCRALRPTLTAQSTSKGSSPDIYKLAEEEGLRCSNAGSVTLGAQAPQQVSPNTIPNSSDQVIRKWTCLNCTYLNFPKAKKCTQCQIPRGKRLTAPAPSPDVSQIEQRRDLTIDVGDSAPERSPPAAAFNLLSSPRPPDMPSIVRLRSSANASPRSPSSPSPGGSGGYRHNDAALLSPAAGSSSAPGPSTKQTMLDSRLIAKKLQKWTCVKCTYENWPKAQRCVMCYSERNKTNGGTYGKQVSPPGAAACAVTPSTSRKAPLTETKSDSDSDSSLPKSSNDKKRPAAAAEPQGQAVHEGGSGRKSPRSSISHSPPAGEWSSGEDADGKMPSFGKLQEVDRRFLQACRWMRDGTSDYLESYLIAGGDPARALTGSEAALLKKYGDFDVGDTLGHIAIKNQRDDLLTVLLAFEDQKVKEAEAEANTAVSPLSGAQSITPAARVVKRVPCHANLELASEIRRHVALSLRQRKGDFPSFFFADVTTFSLPSQLEEEYVINWCLELTDRMGSRLYALWNRTAGDCLLDSVLQACWGVFDSENALRHALADSLNDAANLYYPRWRAYEAMMTLSSSLQFELDEEQWQREWESILTTAGKPGSALEQAHIFALAHIIRRPIVVYGVRLHKSFRGEDIDIAKFEGIYLPFLWESGFCWRSPICLGYTRGHFCALVPMDNVDSGRLRGQPFGSSRFVYLPLTDYDGKTLPVHFLAPNDFGREQPLLRTWLDLCLTEGGQLVCKMKLHRLSPMVQQMVDDWLEVYQRMAILTPPPPPPQQAVQPTSVTCDPPSETRSQKISTQCPPQSQGSTSPHLTVKGKQDKGGEEH